MLTPVTPTNAENELATVKELYETAFPPNERREFGSIPSMLNSEAMRFCIYKDGATVAGLVCYWILNRVAFVEHIAVFPHLRGQQYGQKIMAELLNIVQHPLLLEVEKPCDTESIRRVRFYNRCGLELLDKEYQQPSYDGIKPPVAMALMSNVRWNETDIDDAIREICQRVYAKLEI